MSTVRACRLGGLSRAGWYRKSTGKDQSAMRWRIREIALIRPRFGYRRVHIVLCREGRKGQSQAGSSPLSPRRTAGSDENAPAQESQPASGASAAAQSARGALAYGLCARSTHRRAGVTGAHGRRLTGVATVCLWSRAFGSPAGASRQSCPSWPSSVRCRVRSPWITAPSSPPRRSTNGPGGTVCWWTS